MAWLVSLKVTSILQGKAEGFDDLSLTHLVADGVLQRRIFWIMVRETM
jgi:hypothetical protein